jgi:hypothetical protein
MAFDDAKLAQQVGFLVLNLWRLAEEKSDLTAQLSKKEEKSNEPR